MMVAPIIADLIGSPPPLLLTVLLWPFIIPLLLLEHYRATRTVVGRKQELRGRLHPPPHPTLSAPALAHKIRSRTLTSRELTEAFIARLKAINAAKLNAVCAESFQASLAVADAADAAVANDSIPDGQRACFGAFRSSSRNASKYLGCRSRQASGRASGVSEKPAVPPSRGCVANPSWRRPTCLRRACSTSRPT